MPASGYGIARYAIVGMAQSAGYGLGALAAGGLLAVSSTSAYQALAAANAATFVVSAGLLLLVPAGPGGEPGQRPSSVLAGYRLLGRDRPYLVLTLANTAFAVCSMMLAVALPVYLVDGLGAAGWVAGPVLAVTTVLLSVGQLAATRVMRPLSRVHALMVAGALWTLWGLLTAGAAAVPTGWLVGYLFAVTLLYAFAELVHAPISNALAAEAAPDHSRGSYLAAFQYGFTIASMVVPAGFAGLFAVDPELPWLAVAALAALATAVMPLLPRRLPRSAVYGEVG
jgi:Major Facilitator Superfamily